MVKTVDSCEAAETEMIAAMQQPMIDLMYRARTLYEFWSGWCDDNNAKFLASPYFKPEAPRDRERREEVEEDYGRWLHRHWNAKFPLRAARPVVNVHIPYR